MLRHLLARTMADAGFDVIEAENGEVALRAVARCRDRPRLVVTDISMPVMGGMEFAREFRPLCPRSPSSSSPVGTPSHEPAPATTRMTFCSNLSDPTCSSGRSPGSSVERSMQAYPQHDLLLLSRCQALRERLVGPNRS
jgi:Response regulator receiver domain